MARNERVVILRSGNRFVVEPTTRPIMRLLAPLLSYEEVVQLQGYEYTRAKKAHKPTTYTQPWECFVFDHKGRLGTSMGFYDRVVDALYAAGYDVRQRTLYDHPDPSVFKPRWDRVEGEFRYKQKDALKVFLEYEINRCGRSRPQGFPGVRERPHRLCPGLGQRHRHPDGCPNVPASQDRRRDETGRRASATALP